MEDPAATRHPPYLMVLVTAGTIDGVDFCAHVGLSDETNFRQQRDIVEELDAPGEWFLDANKHILYFNPPAGLDLAKATLETARLHNPVEFRGSEQQPVRFLSIKRLNFRHAARTFMDTKEPVLRSDCPIYRGGAVLFVGRKIAC